MAQNQMAEVGMLKTCESLNKVEKLPERGTAYLPKRQMNVRLMHCAEYFQHHWGCCIAFGV